MASSELDTTTVEGFEVLDSEERYWRDRQEFLESRGYMLRPRFRPGWVPSWRGKSKYAVFKAEDGYRLPFRASVIDATRMSDGALVYIKRVQCDSQELRLLSYLSSEEMRQDPRNHCVPLLDVLTNPLEPTTTFMIMPFLCYIDDPEFELVEDVLECLDQLLEGLTFIHDNNIAHRDCAYKNVMMDATAMFPQSLHPMVQTHLPDLSAPAPTLSRSTVSVRYYFIDFGISTQFAPGQPALVVGTLGLDREPPELSDSVPYDPFKLDVFLIGNMVRRRLIGKYANLAILEPLVERMVRNDPAQRPSASEAHQQLKSIRRRIPTLSRRMLLRPREWSAFAKAIYGAYSVIYAIYRSIF